MQKFGKAHEKVEFLRQQLTDLQSHVDYNSNEEAQITAKGLIDDLRHWSNIEESIHPSAKVHDQLVAIGGCQLQILLHCY